MSVGQSEGQGQKLSHVTSDVQSHGHAPSTVLERSRLALQDDFLRAAVRFTTDRLKSRKGEAATALGHWEEWRERGLLGFLFH